MRATVPTARGNLMHATVSNGAMMAIKFPSREVPAVIAKAAVEGKVTVAAISTHDATTLSGDWASMSKVLKQLPPGWE